MHMLYKKYCTCYNRKPHLPFMCVFVSLFSFVELYLLFVQWFNFCAVCIIIIIIIIKKKEN